MMDNFRSGIMNRLRLSVTCIPLAGALLLAAFSGSSGARQSTPATDGQVIAVKDVRVFDGVKVLPKATVIIKGGRFAAVGEGAPVPPGAEVLAGEGKTLLPGLIDAHVHVWGAANLRQSVMFGVTSVVDMFTTVQFMTETKKAQSTGAAGEQAHLISSGILATAPGGHGTEYGVPVPTLTGPAGAKEFVDARIAEGSDFIKIIVDNGGTYGMSRPTISEETMAAVIAAAHARGKMAVVHADTLANCIAALNAGADGLAHLYFDDAFDPDFGKLAAEKKAFVIPTLTVLQTIDGVTEPEKLVGDPFLSPYLKAGDIQNLRKKFPSAAKETNYRAAERAVRELKEAGATILAGTDSPNPGTTYGASLHRELELLVAAGLTPLEALRAATSAPAAAFKLEGRGRVEPGMTADAVLVNGDPLENIKATRDIARIWQGGRPVDRAKYLEEVKGEQAASERQKTAPAPPGSESGLISDFEGNEVEAKFGAGWMVSTDAMMGGKSKAEMKLVEGGAQGSRKSLLITGTDNAENAQNWAGIMFSPGTSMMAPANLSSKRSITFWAKGDGKRYACLVYAQSRGWTPAVQFFTAGPEWAEFSFPFEKFGIDGSDIMAIFIGASSTPGDFALQVDDVRLK